MANRSSWTSKYFVKDVRTVRDKESNVDKTVTYVVCTIRLSTGEPCGKSFVQNSKSGTGNQIRHFCNEHEIVNPSAESVIIGSTFLSDSEKFEFFFLNLRFMLCFLLGSAKFGSKKCYGVVCDPKQCRTTHNRVRFI